MNMRCFDRSGSLFLIARLVVLGLAGVGLMFAVGRLDDVYRPKAENAFLIGMGLGLAALAAGFVYAKATGNSLWGTFYHDPLTTLNVGAVVLSLLAWPALVMLWRRGQKKTVCVAGVGFYLFFCPPRTLVTARHDRKIKPAPSRPFLGCHGAVTKVRGGQGLNGPPRCRS